MSDFRIDKITNRDGSAGTQICGVSTFSGTSGMQLPSGPTEYRGGRGRGVFGGGESPTRLNNLDLITIATTGNASDFGDLVETATNIGACGSSTRGIWFGGETPSVSNTIQYIIFSSQGGSNNFGNLSFARLNHNSGLSDNTRGITGGAYASPLYYNLIEYVTIASTGDASDFGDLSANK